MNLYKVDIIKILDTINDISPSAYIKFERDKNKNLICCLCCGEYATSRHISPAVLENAKYQTIQFELLSMANEVRDFYNKNHI